MDEYPEDSVPEIKPFRLNAYVIGFVTDGEAKLTINSNGYQLNRGTLYFSSPWDIRSYSNMKKWKGFLLFFTPDYLTQFKFTENKLNELIFFQPDAGVVLSLPETRTVQLIDWFRKIQDELESENPERLKILFHYIHILLYRCKDIYNEVKGDHHESPPNTVSRLFLEQVNHYFVALSDQKLDYQITVKHVADALHLHPHYLSDLVKKQTGKTATQIIRERYVLEAKTLLLTTKMSVSEVSYFFHFKDTSNFTKFFKNISGTTPKEFKEKNFNLR